MCCGVVVLLVLLLLVCCVCCLAGGDEPLEPSLKQKKEEDLYFLAHDVLLCFSLVFLNRAANFSSTTTDVGNCLHNFGAVLL
jgi:hypothetical protein